MELNDTEKVSAFVQQWVREKTSDALFLHAQWLDYNDHDVEIPPISIIKCHFGATMSK